MLTLPETSSTRGALFVIGFGVMIAGLTALLLTLLAWRVTIKTAIAVMLLAAAFAAHFMGSHGVVIDTTMMVNVLQTDPREVRDLLNLRLLGSVLLLAGLPLLLWRTRVRAVGLLRQGGAATCSESLRSFCCLRRCWSRCTPTSRRPCATTGRFAI